MESTVSMEQFLYSRSRGTNALLYLESLFCGGIVDLGGSEEWWLITWAYLRDLKYGEGE
jgi:hypothetical protein